MCLLHTRCPNVFIHISTDASTLSTASGTFHPRFATASYRYIALRFRSNIHSHCMDTSLPSTAFQPRSCGCRCGPSLDSPSIFAPEGTHGGYGTWQLMMLEEVFRLLKTCTGGYLLMKAQQSQFIWCFTHCTCVRAY